MASSRDRQGGGPASEEFVIRVRFAATEDVSDEFLEELTMLVQDALSEHAEPIAPGASAAANFATHQIELDFIVESRSQEEMHRKVGEVVNVAMAAVPPRQPVTFASSQTSATLVPV
jgi:hypothetical protein